MNYVLATLALIGVGITLFEIFGTIVNSKKMHVTERTVGYSFKTNYFRMALVVLLEIGVLVAWITNQILPG